MREGAFLVNSKEYASQMEECAALIHMVQNETYIDKFIHNDGFTDEHLKEAIDAHDEARKRMFQILEENIENWWD